jgi:hypothetical protein
MKYFKSFNDFIFEKKDNGLEWNNFFIEYFSRIGLEQENTADAKIEKLQKFLSKDIFNSVISKSIILSDDDKKTYSQSNTQKKFEILMKQEYIGQMQDRYADDLGNVVDYLSDINTTLRDLDVQSFGALIEKADDYHENLANAGVVISDIREDETPETDVFIKYPNGWYWINLNTHYSADESKNMGHCGRDAGKILFSLRDDKKQSHITASYDPKTNSIYQIKGKANSKPKNTYYPYIVDMILNTKYPVDMIKTGSYKPQNDFSLTDLPEAEMRGIYEKKPSLEMTDKMFEKYHKENDLLSMLSMCVNGYVYDGYVSTRYNDENGINKMFNFIDEQKIDISLPENKEIVKRFITSTISLVASNLVRYDDEILGVLKSLGVAVEISDYEILPYPGVDKLIKYFGIKINVATIVDYITENNLEAFIYAISTRAFALTDSMIASMCDRDVPVKSVEFFLSKLHTSNYLLSFEFLERAIRNGFISDNKLREKVVLFLKNLDTYSGFNLINDLTSDINYTEVDSDALEFLLEMWFSYVGMDDSDIYEILYAFDNRYVKDWYVLKILKEMINYFGVERIMKIMFNKKINPKYLFSMIKHTKKYMSYDEFFVLFNKYYNSCEDIKYCLDVLEEYLEYYCVDFDDVKIDISSKKQEMNEYLKNVILDEKRYKTTIAYLEKNIIN